MKRSVIFTFFTLIAALIARPDELPRLLVNPMIGTAPAVTRTAGMFGKKTEEFGQTLPAVLEPHGMNFWTPQTRATELKCVAPYYYVDSLFHGFRNSHWIVGGCTQDFGSFTVTPLAGPFISGSTVESRASRFSHDDEISRPDYYSVLLSDAGIRAELTGTSRTALMRFTFGADSIATVVLFPNSDEAQASVTIDRANRRILASNPVHRIYQGKGQPAGFSGHIVLEWQDDLDIVEALTFAAPDSVSASPVISSLPDAGAALSFRVPASRSVTFRVASSFTSADAAAANMLAEAPDFDFDAAQARLASVWDRHLSSIEIEGGTLSDRRKFYSALYRASFLPQVFSDADGSYPAFSGTGEILQMPDGVDYYDGFSTWDTYRALHPLLAIIDPDRTAAMMQSLVLKARKGGWLPIFPCWNSYTAAMIGDHCTVLLADAAVKGITGWDIPEAYAYMRRNAFESPATHEEYVNGMGRRALPSYLCYGFIPLEDSVPDAYHKREQVSRTLEYAFDDFALAQVARLIGEDADADTLLRRSGSWRNVIDPSTGYAQGRHADGSFLSDPSNAFSFATFITEGAPCHYTWYVPHDQPGLMELMGGREMYAERLDSMFTFGRYWHGNEPCHQIPWLHNRALRPWLTQRYVREILDTEYLDDPGGLSGNDDAGQMSAWFIFGALGLYPVAPATPYYDLSTPLFPHITVNIPAHGDRPASRFTMICEPASPADADPKDPSLPASDAIYIASATLNGEPYHRSYITHTDLTSQLRLRLSRHPSFTHATSPSSPVPPLLSPTFF